MKKRVLTLVLTLVLTVLTPGSTLALTVLTPGSALAADPGEGGGIVVVRPGEKLSVDPESGAVTPAEEGPESAGMPPQATAAPADPGAFSDVPADAWYALYVNIAAQRGLLQGVGDGLYGPQVKVTLGQVVTIVARIHAQERGETVPQYAAGPWYLAAYDYCVESGLFTYEELPETELPRMATRFELVDFLDRAVPDMRKTAINQVSNWDVADLSEDEPYGAVVYKWYRAGILEGDGDGFRGGRTITRAEMATILCRLTGNVPRVKSW